jgi:hypothetical protein
VTPPKTSPYRGKESDVDDFVAQQDIAGAIRAPGVQQPQGMRTTAFGLRCRTPISRCAAVAS